MENYNLQQLASLLKEKSQQLLIHEYEISEQKEQLEAQKEELEAQKEELTAAIEELQLKNNSLSETLQQLQQRNQELDQILYGTSHDLKTPLSSMGGLLNLLKLEILTPTQQDIYWHMGQKVTQMQDRLNSLTMLSQANFEKIERRNISLSMVVKQVIHDLNYLAQTEYVIIDILYNGLEQVYLDERVLYNLLKCLVSNALTYRSFTKKGFVWISFSRKEEELWLEVTDDGDGISPAISEYIFKMFFRGSDRSGGAGLGLYIVKNTVKRIKGSVDWVSKPGRTTFQVMLPGCWLKE